MRRRDFVKRFAGATVAVPTVASAQQGEQVRRIGVLQPLAATDPDSRKRQISFEPGLEKFGWKPGRNVLIDYRYAAGNLARMRELALSWAASGPMLLWSTPVVSALKAETRAIPIVFAQVIDPVASGFVASIARPGGNLTGVTN